MYQPKSFIESRDAVLHGLIRAYPFATLIVTNAYAPSEAPHSYPLKPGGFKEDHWSLASSNNWFDISVTTAESPMFLRRFAGHVETGRPSTSDPAVFSEEVSLA